MFSKNYYCQDRVYSGQAGFYFGKFSEDFAWVEQKKRLVFVSTLTAIKSPTMENFSMIIGLWIIHWRRTAMTSSASRLFLTMTHLKKATRSWRSRLRSYRSSWPSRWRRAGMRKWHRGGQGRRGPHATVGGHRQWRGRLDPISLFITRMQGSRNGRRGSHQSQGMGRSLSTTG